jgi:hypothetical protein
MLIPPQFLAAGGIALALAGAAGGYKVRDWQCDAAVAKVVEKSAKAEQKANEALNAQALEYEKERARDATLNTAGTSKIREIYRTVQVPATCAADPAAALVLGATVHRANAAAAGELGGAVPPTE